jgi:hypothetical protein
MQDQRNGSIDNALASIGGSELEGSGFESEHPDSEFAEIIEYSSEEVS